MYSYFLYEIICAKFLGVGAHLGAPGTFEIGPNCQISNFLSLIVVASNFQDEFIFAIHEFICVIFLVVETHLGAPGTPKMYPNCQNFNFLSLVVDISYS